MNTKTCKLCSNNIKDMSYLYTHEDEEIIFRYPVRNSVTYKYYKNRRYSDIINCPKCGKPLS